MGDTLKLKQLIIESLHLEGVSAEMIGDDDPLFGSELGLDSVDALELVVVMEQAYGIKIENQEIDQEVFASVANLSAFVNQKVAQDQGTAEGAGPGG